MKAVNQKVRRIWLIAKKGITFGSGSGFFMSTPHTISCRKWTCQGVYLAVPLQAVIYQQWIGNTSCRFRDDGLCVSCSVLYGQLGVLLRLAGPCPDRTCLTFQTRGTLIETSQLNCTNCTSNFSQGSTIQIHVKANLSSAGRHKNVTGPLQIVCLTNIDLHRFR